MSATNTFETSLLRLIFNNTDITGVARGLAAAGNLYISLHTADPGEGGSQSTSEANYGSYARMAVVRNGTGWTVTGGTAENADVISFPLATSGSSLVTHFGIGTVATGAGSLLLKGALNNSLAVSPGIRPIWDTGDLKISVD